MTSPMGKMKLSVVAVTACVTGVAHTYMAAERLTKLAKEHEFAIKIETQGVLGIKNKLTAENIESADVVVIAADIVIDDPGRFVNCRLLNVKISALLLHPDTVIAALKKMGNYPKGKTIDL